MPLYLESLTIAIEKADNVLVVEAHVPYQRVHVKFS
jgi:hypothetical protein